MHFVNNRKLFIKQSLEKKITEWNEKNTIRGSVDIDGNSLQITKIQ